MGPFPQSLETSCRAGSFIGQSLFHSLNLPSQLHISLFIHRLISPSLGYKVSLAFLHTIISESLHIVSLYLNIFRFPAAYREHQPDSPGGISASQSIQQSRNSAWQTVESTHHTRLFH